MTTIPNGEITVLEERVTLTAEQLRRRKARNVAIAISLLILFAMFYFVTLAKLGANILSRPL